MLDLTPSFWQQRYLNQETGWDIGHVSQPLQAYFDQLNDKNLHILIPGGGNGYEAAYLYQQGFKQVYLLDWAAAPLQNFKKNHPHFSDNQLINTNFFEHQGQYDLIIEQTFFCALDPSLRPDYVRQCQQLLKPNGKLVGLLFNIPFDPEKPPYGGDLTSYTAYFAPYFDILIMETCYNSIKPRAGNELFIKLVKK